MGRIRRGAAALVSLAALAALALPSTAGAAPPDDTVWLCKPGLADNPCATDLSTTQLAPTGDVLGETPVRRKKPKVDCFYVYPTVSDDPGVNSDREAGPEERSIALYQAARYAEHCRVYAPLYRQITLEGIFSGEPIGAEERDLSYNDVVDAWKTYLRRYNKGRGVVLIGHSQGTYVLRQLIAERIDKRRGVRKRIVSAILLGGNATVEEGGISDGDFRNIPGCTGNRQTGCAIAFSTFNAAVPADARFGRPGSAVFLPSDPARFDVLCSNPAALRTGAGSLDVVLPSEPFAPGSTIGTGTTLVGTPEPSEPVDTAFIEVEDAYSGECQSADDADVLQISPLGGAPVLNAIPDATWGLHLVDANIALGNLIDVTKRQIAAYVKRSKR